MSEESIAKIALESAPYIIDKPYDYIIPCDIAERVKPGVRVLVGFGKGNRKTEGMVLKTQATTSREAGLKPIIAVLDDEPVLDDKGLRLALWLRERYFCSFYDAVRVMLPSGLWYRIKSTYIINDCATREEALKLLGGIPGSDILIEYLFKKREHNHQNVINDIKHKNTSKILNILTENGIIRAENSAFRNASDKTVRLVRLLISNEDAEEYLSLKSKSAPMQRDIIRLLMNIGAVTVNELRYFTGASLQTLKALHKKGVTEFFELPVFRTPVPKVTEQSPEIRLNQMQHKAFSELEEILLSGKPACALLYGVTGSGKTQIYLKLIEQTLKRGKTAIMLVPEISLTPQLMEKVYSCFGDKTAILHSALSVGERYDEWKRIKSGKASVVIGTRSAVFAPLDNIGIIILDEEQEHTYKSSSTPRYHARDIAKFRCVTDSALLLLGSATPSIESMYHAKTGTYSLHILDKRYNEQELPEVIIADMREELLNGSMAQIGRRLLAEIDKNLSRGEQSILFLNRRGASRYVICGDCGVVPECPKCSVALTFHSVNSRLMCHHCGYSRKMNDTCSECKGKMLYMGAGTQKIEDEIKVLYPDMPVIRMDTDTTSMKSSHETMLSRFFNEKIPVMVGTQMITKGLDFENVTLIGVLSAEQTLFTDDYRAAENTFALITQVIGRAGRGEKKGRAVIQTLIPNNPVIRLAAAQDYFGFYENEIQLRQARGFPPFNDIISILISASGEDLALKGALRVAGKINRALKTGYSDIGAKVFGPAPAFISRLNNKYRFKVMICAQNNRRMRELITRLLVDFKRDRQNRRISVVADVNSMDF